MAARTKGITIFNSDNDAEDIQKSVQLLRAKISNTNYREFHNYGHFLPADMLGNEFPELVKEILAAEPDA